MTLGAYINAGRWGSTVLLSLAELFASRIFESSLHRRLLLQRACFLIGLSCLNVVFAVAGTIVYSNTFTQDNQVLQVSLVSDGISTTIIDSYGYAGGSVGGNSFSPGGFAPEITLYDSMGMQVLDSNSGYTGNCFAVATDSVTGNCDDPYISTILPTGAYTLALTVFDNLSFDGILADGFKQDLNPGFTCSETGTMGQFCDVTDALGGSRTGAYAFSIAEISTATPEPSALALTFCGMLLAGVGQMRRSVQKTQIELRERDR